MPWPTIPFIWAREICLKPNFFKVLLLALRISNFESTKVPSRSKMINL